jgi:phosphoglycolate phosphatase
MKLVLFDIDGTLLLTDGAGRRAIHDALIEVFGTTGPSGHRFDGKTDPQIVRELMRMAGHGDPVIDAGLDRVFELYVQGLELELRAPGYTSQALPGVHALLDALEAESAVTLGLLTGNLLRGARAKLNAVNIAFDRFAVGAFGSDHEMRTALPAIARQRYAEQSGVWLDGADLVIIGDTPADIECGRSLGVRAVGVATGSYSVDELLGHAPAAVLPDLADLDAAMAAILGRR